MPVISIPAPVGGVNARDALQAMPQTDAIRLIGFVPKGTYVETEPVAETDWGASDTNQSFINLIAYENGATKKLIAYRIPQGGGTDNDIVEVDTSTSAITSLKTLTGTVVLGSTMFQTRLIMCNGVDTPQVYNGTSCTDLVATGPTLTTLRGCFTFKGRVYYWKDNDLAFWYAPAGAYQGTLTEFRLDTVSSRGGKITTICSLTRDGGEGADDLFVIVLNTGEILVYQGDDPGNAAAWALVGRFYCPRPVGLKSAAKMGVTTLLLTTDGIIDLGALLSGAQDYFISTKVLSLAKFSPDDATEIVDFQQTNSLIVVNTTTYMTVYQGSLSRPLCYEKTTGAWWQSNVCNGAIAACNLDGKFYFSKTTLNIPSFIASINRVSSTGATFSADPVKPWLNLAKSGEAFAPVFKTTALVDYKPDSTNHAIGAFVVPFGGLIGQATAIQFVYSVDTLGASYRWFRTSLRIKGGGKR